MEKKYKILQIGPEDWQDTLALPAQLDWHHVPPNTPSAIQKIMDEKDLEQFHAVILTDGAYLVDLLPFASSLEPWFSIPNSLQVRIKTFRTSSNSTACRRWT